MKKSRFTDEQIIGFLKHVEAGAAVKEHEGENGKLKKLLAGAMQAKTRTSERRACGLMGRSRKGAAISGGR